MLDPQRDAVLPVSPLEILIGQLGVIVLYVNVKIHYLKERVVAQTLPLYAYHFLLFQLEHAARQAHLERSLAVGIELTH